MAGPLIDAAEVDRPPLDEAERDRRLVLLVDQARELAGHPALDVAVTCPCGRKTPIWRGARCLFCGVWLCDACAARHFAEAQDHCAVIAGPGSAWSSRATACSSSTSRTSPRSTSRARGC